MAGATHPAEYLAVLWRHRWLAVISMIAVAVPTVLWTVLQTPVYQASTRILLAEDTSPVPTLGQRGDSGPGPAESKGYLETQYELLQSRALAKRVVKDLRLAENKAYLKPVPVPFCWGSVSRLFSSKPAPSPVDAPGASQAADDPPAWVVDRFLSDLIVAPLVDSRLVDVKYESPDPALAAQIVNAVARQYIEQDLEFRFKATREASTWIDARLNEQRAKVAESDQKLQNYKEQRDALSVEDRQNIVVQKLSDLNTAVTRAKTDRIQKEQTWNQLAGVRGDRQALESAPPIMQNTFVQALKGEVADLQRQRAQLAERYGERHPEMVRVTSALQSAQARLDAEVEKSVNAIRTDYQTALAQERSLSGALEQQKGEALSLSRKNLEYGALERESTSDRQVYEALLQQAKRAGLAGEVKQSNIQVVDRAEVPAMPVRPRKGRNAALGLLGSLLLTLGLVVAREMLDRTVKTPDDLQQHLRLPCLGMVPAIADAGVASHAVLDQPNVPPGFSEAFRRVRGNVWLGVPSAKTGVLLVTSAAPREGKTLVAANLAAAMAASGERVLLIDADMRRPRQHEVLSVAREPGLSNVLAGRAPLASAIQTTAIERLSLLPAGPQPPNPTELLDRNRFRLLVDSLDGQFDWVVIDSAPVLAVADAAVIARDVNGVVFVACADQTRRDAAQEAVQQLRAANSSLVGAVLNRVDLARQAGYYSRYYRRDYEKYYVKQE